jgi:hypothetical protein
VDGLGGGNGLIPPHRQIIKPSSHHSDPTLDKPKDKDDEMLEDWLGIDVLQQRKLESSSSNSLSKNPSSSNSLWSNSLSTTPTTTTPPHPSTSEPESYTDLTSPPQDFLKPRDFVKGKVAAHCLLPNMSPYDLDLFLSRRHQSTTLAKNPIRHLRRAILGFIGGEVAIDERGDGGQYMRHCPHPKFDLDNKPVTKITSKTKLLPCLDCIMVDDDDATDHLLAWVMNSHCSAMTRRGVLHNENNHEDDLLKYHNLELQGGREGPYRHDGVAELGRDDGDDTKTRTTTTTTKQKGEGKNNNKQQKSPSPQSSLFTVFNQHGEILPQYQAQLSKYNHLIRRMNLFASADATLVEAATQLAYRQSANHRIAPSTLHDLYHTQTHPTIIVRQLSPPDPKFQPKEAPGHECDSGGCWVCAKTVLNNFKSQRKTQTYRYHVTHTNPALYQSAIDYVSGNGKYSNRDGTITITPTTKNLMINNPSSPSRNLMLNNPSSTTSTRNLMLNNPSSPIPHSSLATFPTNLWNYRYHIAVRKESLNNMMAPYGLSYRRQYLARRSQLVENYLSTLKRISWHTAEINSIHIRQHHDRLREMVRAGQRVVGYLNGVVDAEVTSYTQQLALIPSHHFPSERCPTTSSTSTTTPNNIPIMKQSGEGILADDGAVGGAMGC